MLSQHIDLLFLIMQTQNNEKHTTIPILYDCTVNVFVHMVACALCTLQGCTIISISSCPGTRRHGCDHRERQSLENCVSQVSLYETKNTIDNLHIWQAKSLHLWTQTPVVENCVTSVWRSSWTVLPPNWSMPSQAGGLFVVAAAQTDTGSLVLLRALEKLFWSRRER